MKKLILLTFMISLNSQAENFRAPAVLDGSCNLDIPTTFKVVVNGKDVIQEKPLDQIQKEQCKEVKKCMNSAAEEEMEELKSLEAVACNNTLNAVTTKTPGAVIDKNFDGKRKAKATADVEILPGNSKDTTKTVTK